MKKLRDNSIVLALKFCKAMNDWIEYKLGDIAVFSQGIQVGIEKQEETCKDGYVRFIRIVDYTKGTDEPRYILYPGAKYMVDETDIVMMRYGTPGKVARGYSGAIANNMFKITVNEHILIKDFAFYYLSQDSVYRTLIASNSSSTMPAINFKIVERLDISAPSLSEQKRLVEILKCLDDKIENNRRVNENLEQQAQALFKSWFVDFEPFKNGEFVESELGRIPKGWRVESLSSIADYINGLAMQKFRPLEEEKGLPVLKIKELGQGSVDDNSELCSPSLIGEKNIIDDGDIIFSWSGTLMVKIWCGGKCGLNQHLFKVVAKNFPKWFVYQWTKHHLDNFIRIAKDKAVTMGHIKRGELDKAKVLIPESHQMNTIIDIMKPIHLQMISNELESRRLAEIRDTLLPKLMSGELRVSDTDLINEMLEKGIR